MSTFLGIAAGRYFNRIRRTLRPFFWAAASTWVQAAPTLAPLPDLSLFEDSGTQNVPVQFDPGDRPVGQFQLRATADNPGLIAAGGLRFIGSGTNQILQFLTRPDAFGATTLSVIAQTTNEPLVTLTQQFRLTVQPINDPPRIEPLSNLALTEGLSPVAVPLLITDPDDEPYVVVSVSGRPANLVAVTLVGAGTNRQLRITLPYLANPPATGRNAVTVTARDKATSVSLSFFVTVAPRDFVPANQVGRGVPFWTASLGSTASTHRWADLNQDGYPDAAVLGQFETQLMLNPAGVSTEGNRRLLQGTRSLNDAVWGDVDGNGSLEVFVYGSSNFGMYRSTTQGAGIMVPMTNALEVVRVEGAALTDLDGNGTLDLIYSGTETNGTFPRVILALNPGAGVFTMVPHTLPPVAGPLVTADFDNDGRTDLLLCSRSTNTAARIFWNRGPGIFVPGPVVGDVLPVTAAGTADLDGDGRADAWLVHLLTNSGKAPGLRLDLYRQQSGALVRTSTLSTNEFRGVAAPAWGDFDHDGRVDFAAPYEIQQLNPSGTWSPTNYLAIYHNTGDNFIRGNYLCALPAPVPSGLPNFIPSAADVDQDGDLDLVGFEKSTFYPFLNQVREPNIPPNAPENLRSFVVGEQLFLFWSPATDLNQSTPLSYNVRAGSAPGKADLVPAHSLTNGTRMLVGPGNAGFLNSFVFELAQADLGAVYWSVQAIDASWAGGPFASEQALVVDRPGNAPPQFDLPAEISLLEDTVTNLPIVVSDDRTAGPLLTLSLENDNPALLPSDFLRLYTTRTNSGEVTRSLRIQPAPDQYGIARVSLIATDRSGASATNVIRVMVQPVNDLPWISPAFASDADRLHLRGASATVLISVGDLETPASELKITVHSSDPELVPTENVVIRGDGGERVLTATPGVARAGVADLWLTVTDADGATNRAMTTLTWQDQLFIPLAPDLGPAPQSETHWVDWDGDGALDLVGLEPNGMVVVWSQTSPGRFTLAARISTGLAEATLLPGDFDRDGNMDLVVAARGGTAGNWGSVFRLRNDAGQLGAPERLRTSGAFRFMVATDLDSEGSLDLVGANSASDLSILWNQAGSLSWWATGIEDPQDLLNGHWTESLSGLVAADLNNDGRMDLVLSHSEGSAWSVVLQQRSIGSFLVVPVPWRSEAQLVSWTDFDHNGWPDALVTASGPGVYGSWVEFRDDQGALASRPFPFGPVGGIGDSDGDGWEDVLAWQSLGGGFVTVSRLAAEPFHFLSQEVPNFFYPQAASGGDFDHDGRLDLLLNSSSESAVAILKGHGGTPNQPPVAPGNLTFAQTGPDSVELSWAESQDPNQAGGLTYNVRAGTVPGTNDIVSAQARPDGQGLVPSVGNAGWRTRFRLTGLEVGPTYHWTVQAVDSGFARSGFNSGATLTLSGWPTISALADLFSTNGATPVEVLFSIGDAETAGDDLQVSVVSSNPVLLPASRLKLGGSGTNRLLLLEPQPDRAGSAEITVRVIDASQFTRERKFKFTVPSPNGFAAGYFTTVVVAAGSEVLVPLDAFDPHHDFDQYWVTSSAEHGAVQGAPPAVSYQPETGFTGTDRIAFRATRAGSLDAYGVITLQVVPRHHLAPELRLIATVDQRLRVLVRALPGARIRLETSRDLRGWQAAGEFPIPANEAVLLDPLPESGEAPQFFRAVKME